jgi:protein-S-isoprenylcysteine O-methyltransferase Ste14
MVLLAWAMAVNPFAETTVRIQTERGHTVVSSGPYRLVRHPMYAGAILMFLGTPLILGSMLALLLAIEVVLLFVGRTALEDRTLRRELLGYEAHAAWTRYRLLPGVW